MTANKLSPAMAELLEYMRRGGSVVYWEGKYFRSDTQALVTPTAEALIRRGLVAPHGLGLYLVEAA